jgi:pyruvate/2-oxoglutarate/acetoin dehydrogenase E1 component
MKKIGSNYRDEIKRSMEMLAKDERILFLGQTVGYSGSRFTYGTLENIASEKRIELPIMEETQMGISIGLALEGYIPLTVYPRFDFLLLATNQIVNHLDKIESLSHGQFKPKVIIRTIVGSKTPIYPGPQHCQEYTEAFERMLGNVNVYRLDNPEKVFPAYQKALNGKKSSLMIELGDLHYSK